MNLRIYCIVEEGADRIYVCGTSYPSYYKKPAGKQAMIVAIDADVPTYDSADAAVSGHHSATWDTK